MRLHLTALSAALVAALGISGCGAEQPAAEPTATETAEGGDAVGAAGVEVTGGPSEKPQIELPGGEPPAELVISDIREGDGEAATADSVVETHYVGVTWPDGEQFDSSWDRGSPIEFPLSGVIPGWTQGIPGMKVGGRRLLVIPPELAYADNPPPGSGIEPGDTLVFVIDLVGVQ